ncbi:helix-turn-helix transcriptional regulator [Bythopirellula polymerisocia]|uniref:Response regulator FixJ n=1 Tax=Bythopirellula polymerisocia TaxID=2528003 RepID=A0A5C6CAE8_9BACT|nr:helix-turn-helix transcriptional regulator [Bythopirellula polymerisocia]TWU20356.1 response regulator FixJ [Bythopirellula polymerisocia]
MNSIENHDGRESGHSLFSLDVWSCIAQQLSLSERELQISQGVFDDKKESVIAQELGISPHTAHTHLERLYHKLRVNSRVELIVRLAECHLWLCQDPDSPVPPICHRHNSGDCPFCS